MASRKSSGPGPGPGSAPATADRRPNFWKPCAILLDSSHGPILGGKALGVPQSEVNSYLFTYNKTHVEPSMGFYLEFPFNQANEEEGFGLCHRVNNLNHAIVQADMRRIEVRFPREGFSRSIEPVVSDALRSRFPGTKKPLSLVRVSLRDPSLIKVHGFGMPFKGPGHPFEELLNHQGALLQFLRQKKIRIIVAAPSPVLERDWDARSLPLPVAYPYGNIHSWDEVRHATILGSESLEFPPTWSYHDDNAHLAVMIQTQVQDFMWLDGAVDEIASQKFSAYFVEYAQGNTSRYYVIMALSRTLKVEFEHALCHLAKGAFKLDLYDNWEDEAASGQWDAKVVNPQGIDALNAHHLAGREMILLVRRPLLTQAARGSEFKVTTFHDRLAADLALNEQGYERKVNTICLFQPGKQPTNSIGGARDEVDFKMSLHRDLVRGTGFYDTLLGYVPSGPSPEPLGNLSRSLPVINLLGTDQDRVEALVHEVLPQDRARFQTYLSERPLGLGVITPGPGLGNTTALVVGTIGMSCSLGKIYATGPTDEVVNDFAARLDHVDTRATDRMNDGRDEGDRIRYKHVVRGYKIDDEASAFLHLLRCPDDGDKAAPNSFLSGQSEWKMHLSAAYWLLALLRSPSPRVRPLRRDESAALHEMRSRIENDKQLHRLRALASQGIDWIEYEQGAMLSKDRLVSLLEEVVRVADIVCTTPSLSAKEPYSAWKREARGIAVDDAACMSRPDLYCVWGNTLLPCLMAGDDEKLPPAALYSHNRFGQHARISPFIWFKAMGWPVYRLGLSR
ncbi:uncharacterized protein NECHADRAFT_79480 [Fusarium vanettenii 77-13-4]|uniref:Uncharacterized protein n=1 Tax=Fusarium vanettenii (strain ATCC MYA-4622 / CBS 123669 / FGSC 9596 / NRRL 45880 / 77-13-4) TaxID=660122 RepID=C7YNZ7_FUSV7|nr:uncharacterized protein NECHADRAFT_79480 [Fusarium vanettenii 77-13-4]EEU46665.1 hypothetical protein NECHADRAFT_79480 [Fusarium vanettenii 77-13-4]